MNILVVSAHPDDAEIFCGGTIIKYVKMGHKVCILICTDGSAGSDTLTEEEISKVRKKEAEEASKIMGTELVFLDYKDEFFPYSDQARLEVLDIIRKLKADTIFTHHPEPYSYKDHDTVSRIVSEAAQFSSIKNIPTNNQPTKEQPYLYYFETFTGIGFKPEEYVDVTDVMQIKKEALLKHESQNSWMQLNLIDFIETKAKFRGYQCGCKYSEAFVGFKPFTRKYYKSVLPQYL